MNAYPWLTHASCRTRLGGLDALLRELVRTDDANLAPVAAHLVAQGGKRLRPALVLLAAEAGTGTASGGDDDRLLKAAAAVELLHIASLYHDDVMDRADTRRGLPTAHARFGQVAAVAAGTFVFSRAVRVLATLEPRVARWMAQGVLALALGQLHETENAYDADRQIGAYLEVSARKTAALFELPCRAGAALAGASEEGVESLAVYGRALGLAFQAVDDVLDLTADAGELGKPPGSDLRAGIYGLPTLIALSHSPASAVLQELLTLDEPHERDLAEARRLVLECGATEHARRIAEDYVQQAASAALSLPGTPARSALIDIAHYVVLRSH